MLGATLRLHGALHRLSRAGAQPAFSVTDRSHGPSGDGSTVVDMSMKSVQKCTLRRKCLAARGEAWGPADLHRLGPCQVISVVAGGALCPPSRAARGYPKENPVLGRAGLEVAGSCPKRGGGPARAISQRAAASMRREGGRYAASHIASAASPGLMLVAFAIWITLALWPSIYREKSQGPLFAQTSPARP